MIRIILDLTKHLFKLRTCKHKLSETNIKNKKFKKCLEFHIGNCLAPCEGQQTKENYNVNIESIKHILKGNTRYVINYLKEKMNDFSETFDFENAQIIKEKINLLENYQSKSTVVSSQIHNVEVYSFIDDKKRVYINYLKVLNGSIIQSHNLEIEKKLDEQPADLLLIAIIDLRQRYNSESEEIIVPFTIDFPYQNIKITIPQRGEKMNLLSLSERNAKYFKIQQNSEREKVDPERHAKRILETMKTDLKLEELPTHIECFDNSNLQGTNAVAACVVFKNSKPDKKSYRHYNIKTVDGIDDFGSMKEIILRRYKRLLDEKQNLPQLIVVDGGKGQLSAAVESLDELKLRGKIVIIGIAKRLEEIYFPNDSIPLYINKNSETLKILQQLRNEAHRFGITFHRNQRSKNFITTELNEIEGIGEKTQEKLLQHFKSVKKIKSVSEEELAKIVGHSRAKTIISFFNQSKDLN